ncbi:uncharacterized protein LY89DRAFT_565026, partial [Mollisia scopiformis]
RTQRAVPSRPLRSNSQRQFVTEAINASHTALQSVHDLSGLPWALSLPLFALVLRTTFILPLSIYQRRAAQRQVQLEPLIQAWRFTLQKQAMKQYGHLGPQVAEQALISSLRKKRREIYRRYRCGIWKGFLGLAQLPVFLTIMEALRNMSGSSQGWIGMMFGDGLVAEAIRIPVESSFANEGMLWFPDLLVADPQLVLPFILSGTILLNVFGGGIKGQDLALPKWQVRLKRNMGLVALCIGPIMIHVPSALVLYWLSSSGFAFLQASILERVMPIKSAPKPC